MPPDGTDKREYPWEVRDADPDALRSAMSHFPTGVTVVTSGREERRRGHDRQRCDLRLPRPTALPGKRPQRRAHQPAHQGGRLLHGEPPGGRPGRTQQALRLARTLQRPSGAPLFRRRLRLDRGAAGGRRTGGDRLRAGRASTREATTTCSWAGSSRSVWAIRARDH